MDKLDFMECDACRSKPGSPLLCASCLHNRTVIDALKALLRESKREHYHCEDSFFCCARCEHPNHGGGVPPAYDEGHSCTCGADDWNIRIDQLLKGVSNG